MLFLYAFSLVIFLISVINLLRITVFSILSDYYDLKLHRQRRHAGVYKPFISVIVPAHNERLVLERCLKSIYASDYRRFEVIVVDDGSVDNTAAHGHYLRRKHGFKNLHVVRKRQNGGKASALNYGIQLYTKGSVIVAMDADCTLDPQALTVGAGYFRDPAVNAVASNVRVMQGTGILGTTQLLEYMLAYRLKKALSVLNIEYLAGCTSFFRRSAIKKVGYYDTDTIAEDFDFSLKLIRKLNGSITYAEDAICYTEGVQSLKDLYRQRFRWRYGSFQAFFKNRGMFFNRTEHLSKFLTWILLPWLLSCEMLFLLEPYLAGGIIYYAARYHFIWGVIYSFVLYGALVATSVLADNYLGRWQKLKFLLLAPAAYPLFLIINYVGYASLVKSLLKSRGIVNTKNQSNGWISPSRAAAK